MFLNRLCNFLEVVEFQHVDINTIHNTWTENEQHIITKITDIYNFHNKDTNIQETGCNDTIEKLLKRHQIQQKTPEWYNIMKQSLSASEIGYIFSESSRRQLIFSKLFAENNFRDSPIESSLMSATDWGVRFEPVVKQIYSDKYSASVKELGKLFDSMDSRYCASPDGLISEGLNKKGRLIEIKCPVTRKIQDNIPKQYYNQIQMQLHITGIKTCDYIEARFCSTYSKHIETSDVCLYSGNIYLVYDQKEYKNRYEYSPLNNSDWTPNICEYEIIIEKIPWKLYNWKEVTVEYDSQWWNNMKPYTELFWNEYNVAKETPDIFKKQKVKNNKKESCLIRIAG